MLFEITHLNDGVNLIIHYISNCCFHVRFEGTLVVVYCNHIWLNNIASQSGDVDACAQSVVTGLQYSCNCLLSTIVRYDAGRGRPGPGWLIRRVGDHIIRYRMGASDLTWHENKTSKTWIMQRLTAVNAPLTVWQYTRYYVIN